MYQKLSSPFISILLFLLFTSLHAQTPSYVWTSQMGGLSTDRGSAIVVDDTGNVYITGNFNGIADFDPGPGDLDFTTAGSSDIFVQKLDSSGNLVWANQIGGTGGENSLGIALDNSNNVYITGYFEDTVDFDPGVGTFDIPSTGGDDIFVLKLDNGGNFVWAKNMGGLGSDAAWAIATDQDNSVFITGLFNITADFDPDVGTANLSTNGSDDAFVEKLDSNGNFVWVKQIGSSNSDIGYGITTDIDGNILTIGKFRNTIDFDPGPGSASISATGSDDVFLQKLDKNGDYVWAGKFGGTGFDQGYAVATDDQKNVFITGYFNSTADFDPGAGTFNLVSNGSFDLFVEKLDSSGNYVWAYGFGSSSLDIGRGIAANASGDVFVTGSFRNTVDFDPGPDTLALTSGGTDDFFILKLDAAGDLGWGLQFGGTQIDNGNAIVTDPSGNIYTTGFFDNTVDFDPGLGFANFTTAGNSDIFVQKLNECTPIYLTDTLQACDSLTWINGLTYTASNNTDTYTIIGGPGCDTIISLDLTVNYSSSAIDVHTACDSFVWIDGLTYFESIDTASFFLTNAAGCDSFIVLDLTLINIDTSVSNAGGTLTAGEAGASYQWLACPGYSVIPGDTNQSFSPDSSGDYAVIITQNGCTDTSECTTVTLVASEGLALDDQMSLYPNPTRGTLTVRSEQKCQKLNLHLTDLNGKLLQSWAGRNTNILELEIAGSPGIYFLEINADGRKAVQKVVKF